MSDTVCIRNADWVIAWDDDQGYHGYARDIDVAFTGTEIVHVGPAYDGEVDREIDGRDLVIMPGLVNIHSHPMSEPMNKDPCRPLRRRVAE